MVGYTKQAPFSSALYGTSVWFGLNNELSNISAAFNATSGHAHDSTAGGGAPVDASSLNTSKLTTSDPHIKGKIWNNSGVLTVSAG